MYIFEGEKCAQAAHHLSLAAITSMMGSSQAEHVDWAILAQYRHIKRFILIPDNDSPGKKYMEAVYRLILKVCPHSEIAIFPLSISKQGDDFIDWILEHESCPKGWDGFSPIDEPCSAYLKNAFEGYVSQHKVDPNNYFSVEKTTVAFDKEPEPIGEITTEVLPCPIETLPDTVKEWITVLADQMQIPCDYLIAPWIVYVGSLIGRKRALRLRPGTEWIEHSNLWGMVIGRSSVMKSPAMKAVRRPLAELALQAKLKYEDERKQYEFDSEAWKIRRKANEEVYKKEIKSSIENRYSLSKIEYGTEESPKQPMEHRYKTDDPTTEKSVSCSLKILKVCSYFAMNFQGGF